MKAWIMTLAAALAVCLAPPSFGQGLPARNDQRRQPVVVKVSEGGFKWADAAVGAAAASGVALVLAGLSMFRQQLRKEEQWKASPGSGARSSSR
jgi:hypothetical protein